MDKLNMFKKAMSEFTMVDKPSTDDYLKLFQTVQLVTRQGSGLMWTDIELILNEVLK